MNRVETMMKPAWNRIEQRLAARRRGWLRGAGAAVLLLAAHQTFALEFVPSDLEWGAWPTYCRARYMVSGAGSQSRYAGKVSRATIDEWELKLKPVWYGLHHYCAGIHLFARATREKEKRFARSGFERVASEASFSLARASESHPFYSTILTLRGRAYFELGQFDNAKLDFARAIQLHPEVSDPYAAWGLLLRRSGHPTEARETLERGIESTKGGTAELHYLLGIVLFDVKDYEGALEHAKIAYKKGYPLPGLKRKLKNAGHWKD